MVDFYCRPKFLSIGLVLVGMANLTVLAYAPDQIPYEFLYFYGLFLKYLCENFSGLLKLGTILAWFAHIGEAIYVTTLTTRLRMSLKCKIYWFVQTLLCGFPSTILIRQYYAKRNK